MNPKTQIIELANRGDRSGLRFTLPEEELAFVGRIYEIHMAETKKVARYRNQYHLLRREAIVVLPGAKWSFHWTKARDRRPSTASSMETILCLCSCLLGPRMQ